MLFRSIGVSFVFVSFLLGVITSILFNAHANNVTIDWLPWLLSGCALGIALSFRTNVVCKHISLGGVISGLICFFILLTSKWFGIYSVVAALMLFGAGMGISFISARHIIQKYFLKYTGNQVEKIAIHKWMSNAGGSNEVSIGKSGNCTIRMDWDNHQSLQDIHVKLFVDKKNKRPTIKILSDNVVYHGIFSKTNDEFVLKNGIKFTIGNTEFQYLEN